MSIEVFLLFLLAVACSLPPLCCISRNEMHAQLAFDSHHIPMSVVKLNLFYDHCYVFGLLPVVVYFKNICFVSSSKEGIEYGVIGVKA